MNSYITIHPSNWLYNASVIGFLKVVAHSCGDAYVENWLQPDGTVIIDRSVFKRSHTPKRKKLPQCLEFYINYLVSDSDLKEWLLKKDKKKVTNEAKYKKEDIVKRWKLFGYKFILAGNKLFTSDSPYQNLVQLKEWRSLEFVKLIKKLIGRQIAKSGIACGICSNKEVVKPGKNSQLENRLFTFQNPHMRLLAPSIGEFPNAFWNLRDSLLICPLCAYLMIHHHIPFEDAQTMDGQIFINAPSFKVMWYLNKFAKELLSKNRSYQLREILGISFIEFAQRVFVTLGAWSIMNIEMVIKKTYKTNVKIDSYSLPYEISRLLLQKEIASLISATKEPLVLEIILNGKFDNLLTLANNVLRYSFTEKKANDDKHISQLRNRDIHSLKNLARVLPELYAKINSTLKREV